MASNSIYVPLNCGSPSSNGSPYLMLYKLGSLALSLGQLVGYFLGVPPRSIELVIRTQISPRFAPKSAPSVALDLQSTCVPNQSIISSHLFDEIFYFQKLSFFLGSAYALRVLLLYVFDIID